MEVLTKLCVFAPEEFDEAVRHPDSFVRKRIDTSKRAMGYGSSDPLDCVQLYWHEYERPGLLETFEALVRARDDGLIRSVGTTNFNTEKLEILTDRVGNGGLSLNQIQFSVIDPRPCNAQIEFCKLRNVAVLAFGATAGGFLSDKYLGVPAGQVIADTFSKRKYASIISERGGWSWFQGLLQILSEVARRHGVTIAQVAQRYPLQHGADAIILGARNNAHLPETVGLFDFQLTSEDLGLIDEYVGRRQPLSDVYEWERGLGPF